MNQQAVMQLGKDTISEWSEDKVPKLAAALAYYTAFAIAPLLVIAIAVAGLVFGQEAATNQIGQQVSGLLGPTAGEAVNGMVAAASARQGGSIVATIIGVITLLFGASGVFGELQDSLNTIWEVQPKPGLGFFATLKKRFFSFTMVLGVGFLLLVSLVVSAALAAFGGIFGGEQADESVILKAINFAVSFGVTTLLFALIFKIIPDAKVQWRDVWIGAVVTALLFTIGKAALGWYLGRPTTTSSYGAAGSFVALLLWVYYSAQILFLGAEFTQVYAKMYGSKIQPDEDAVPVTEEARAEQGIPRREEVEQTAALKEREVGGAAAVSSSNGDRTQANNSDRGQAHSDEAPNRKSGGAAAVAGFLVGLVIGRRQRTHK
jgi:membrane protein